MEAKGPVSATTDSSGRASLVLAVVQDSTAWAKVSCKGYHSHSGRAQIKPSQARIAVGLKPILKLELEGPRQALAGDGGKSYAARLAGGSQPYEFSWFIDGVEQAARGPNVEVSWVNIGDHQLACEARE
jgi:hypothetical protein